MRTVSKFGSFAPYHILAGHKKANCGLRIHLKKLTDRFRKKNSYSFFFPISTNLRVKKLEIIISAEFMNDL